VSEVDGPAVALALIDGLDLDDHHPFHATRPNLLRRLHRTVEAAGAYERAASLAPTSAERNFLADVPGLAELLREDVVLEMPPALLWFAGRDDAVAFFAHRVLVDPDSWRAVPTAANTQPAVACYRRTEDGVYRANSIHLLTVSDKAVERLTVFVEPRLFESFGLPEVYED
jgi:hypothetical protein